MEVLTNRLLLQVARTTLLTLLLLPLLLCAASVEGRRRNHANVYRSDSYQGNGHRRNIYTGNANVRPRPSSGYQGNGYHSNRNINPIVVNSGRHVCMKQQETQTPVKRRESFCKPVYKKHIHMCDRDGHYQLCTSFKVVYQLAYREGYHMETKAQMVYGCCPGWAQRAPGENGCLKPVCDCKNGGQCIMPGVCTCPSGWTGKDCGTDKDECRGQTDRCQQICTNTPGSYSCSCEDGFTLNADGLTCRVCLTCIPEYKEVFKGFERLNERVGELEKEKADLQDNVNQIQEDYKREIERLQNDIATVQHTNLTTVAPPIEYVQTTLTPKKQFRSNTQMKRMWDRIRSLSEQMGLLEERLGECTCDTREPGT